MVLNGLISAHFASKLTQITGLVFHNDLMDQCLGIGDEASTLEVLQFSILRENTIN